MERLPPAKILKKRRREPLSANCSKPEAGRGSGKARGRRQEPGQFFSKVAAAEPAELADCGGSPSEQSPEGFGEVAVARKPELEREVREVFFDPVECGSQSQLGPIARQRESRL